MSPCAPGCCPSLSAPAPSACTTPCTSRAGPLPPPSPAELEEKKKAAEKKKRDEEKKQRDADKKAGKAKPEKPGPRDLPYEPFSRPRQQYLLDQLWAYYESKGINKEPVFEAWQTAHKPIVTQIVNATRHAVLPDGPTISVGTNECHTIRCRFILTAASTEPLEQMKKALSELQLGGGSLWHSFKPGKVTLEPNKREGAEPKYRLELTVSFMRDLPTLARIELPGRGPLRTPPPPPRPSTGPGAIPGPQPSSTAAAGSPGTEPAGTRPKRPGKATEAATPGPTAR